MTGYFIPVIYHWLIFLFHCWHILRAGIIYFNITVTSSFHVITYTSLLFHGIISLLVASRFAELFSLVDRQTNGYYSFIIRLFSIYFLLNFFNFIKFFFLYLYQFLASWLPCRLYSISTTYLFHFISAISILSLYLLHHELSHDIIHSSIFVRKWYNI